MKLSKELVKGTSAMLVLSVLSRKDLYGYRIIRELELRSETVFCMNEGTLYPVLHALEAERCLESYWEEHDGRKRKYYHLTKKGQKLLAEKKEEWQVYADAVARVLNCAEA